MKKKKKNGKPSELAKKVTRAIRRAARNAHRITPGRAAKLVWLQPRSRGFPAVPTH